MGETLENFGKFWKTWGKCGRFLELGLIRVRRRLPTSLKLRRTGRRDELVLNPASLKLRGDKIGFEIGFVLGLGRRFWAKIGFELALFGFELGLFLGCRQGYIFSQVILVK